MEEKTSKRDAADKTLLSGSGLHANDVATFQDLKPELYTVSLPGHSF